MAHGITSGGFVTKTEAEILAEIEADQLADIGPLLDLSADSPQGQLNRIFARQLAQGWAELEKVHTAGDPREASDDALVSHGKLTGTERRKASYTTVLCSVAADQGTILPSGEAFASIDGDDSLRFTPEEDFTAPFDGTHTGVRFRSEERGSVPCGAGDLTTIATSIVGWNSITNPLEGEIGREVDDDVLLRERRETQLSAAGSGTVHAIRSDLFELDGVEACTILENRSMVTDSDGLPGKSFEALLYAPTVTDDEIAQAIWDAGPAGIASHGGDFGTAADDEGETHAVRFSRVDPVEVWVDYELETDASYTDAATFSLAVADAANDAYRSTGLDVDWVHLLSIGQRVTGVVRVISMRLDIVDPPVGTGVGTGDVEIGAREVARFAAARVTVV